MFQKIKTTFALQLIDFIEVNFSYYGILQALSSYLVFCATITAEKYS